jgi:hypothetical protein
MEELSMATVSQRSPWWAALFFALAAANIIELALGVGHTITSAVVALGFVVVALAALYKPAGFLAISARQLKSPRTLSTGNCAALIGVAFIVVGTAISLVGASLAAFKI